MFSCGDAPLNGPADIFKVCTHPKSLCGKDNSDLRLGPSFPKLCHDGLFIRTRCVAVEYSQCLLHLSMRIALRVDLLYPVLTHVCCGVRVLSAVEKNDRLWYLTECLVY